MGNLFSCKLKREVNIDVSDLPLYCLDVRENEEGEAQIVTGGANHSANFLNIANPKQNKELYLKKKGHSEWVTSCGFLHSGNIVTGGMDSKICIWSMSTSTLLCEEVTFPTGHSRSISKILVPRNLSLSDGMDAFFSASYDKCIKLWRVTEENGRTRTLPVQNYSGNESPVLDLKVGSNESKDAFRLLSSSRSSTVMLLDVETSAHIFSFNSHKGQVSAIEINEGMSFTGDQGGLLRLFDERTGCRPVVEKLMHQNAALTEFQIHPNLITTAGADKKICILDLRKAETPLVTVDVVDFVYSMKALFNKKIVLCGLGNGDLCCLNLEGEIVNQIKDSVAAVRCIEVVGKYLVTAGDTGSVSVYT
eukprot:augustus_masked-scaffold_9-processed-gene-7.7-mRNA-1 protein AED:0.20 eAED:0.26 QI:0/-1/0/1/-1/1/1/0/362